MIFYLDQKHCYTSENVKAFMPHMEMNSNNSIFDKNVFRYMLLDMLFGKAGKATRIHKYVTQQSPHCIPVFRMSSFLLVLGHEVMKRYDL
ncbi:hypothetical protein LXL04_033882 [Taraxacum kok-saghyz]